VTWHLTAIQESDTQDRARSAVDLSQPAWPRCDDGYAGITRRNQGAHSMMDVLMIALAIGFFALAIGYTYACERL